MPLNTYNDAVGPDGPKSVRDIALALDLVTGADPEDAVTLEAAAHRRSVVRRRPRRGLAERRAHRRVPAALRRHHRRARSRRDDGAGDQGAARRRRDRGGRGGPDYDDEYRVARGSAPGSLKAGWTAYLSRGAAPGDRVMTVQELVRSGKMAPGGQRRLEDALRPAPPARPSRPPPRRSSRGARRSGRCSSTLDGSRALDALLYPANQARPHTHEGGARTLRHRAGHVRGKRRYRPAAGHRAGRISRRALPGRRLVPRPVVGRPRMLAIAYAYEQATNHRRAPSTVK